MPRYQRYALVLALTLVPLLLAACAPRVAASGSGRETTVAPTVKARATDPLVAAAVRALESTSPPAVSGEIVGYIVDWRKDVDGEGYMVLELTVMADGSVHRPRPLPFPYVIAGPLGKHDSRAPVRLGPEPQEARDARKLALGLATERVESKLPELKDAKVDVFSYLVRITRSDGSRVDMWVSPEDGAPHGRLGPLQPWNPSEEEIMRRPRAQRLF